MEIFVPAITQMHERFQEPELKGANHEEGAMIGHSAFIIIEMFPFRTIISHLQLFVSRD